MFVFIVGMWNLLHLNFCLGVMTYKLVYSRWTTCSEGRWYRSYQFDLGDLLVFVTGADHSPPLGFLLSPEVEFTDDTSRTLPWASTCTVMLYLSKEYDLFCNKMDNSMICSHGFGIV